MAPSTKSCCPLALLFRRTAINIHQPSSDKTDFTKQQSKVQTVVTKMNNTSGSYCLLFLSLFNFAALVCVTIYHIQYERSYKVGDITVNGSEC